MCDGGLLETSIKWIWNLIKLLLILKLISIELFKCFLNTIAGLIIYFLITENETKNFIYYWHFDAQLKFQFCFGLFHIILNSKRKFITTYVAAYFFLILLSFDKPPYA